MQEKVQRDYPHFLEEVQHNPQIIQVLLVEENHHDVFLIQETLRDFKVYNAVHVVGDGESALAFLHHKAPYENAPRPDLILLDLNLPRMDGKELLEQIKNDADTMHIPVAVLTTSDQEEGILRTFQLRANCYVNKPITVAGLHKLAMAIDHFWFAVVRLEVRGKSS